MGYRLSFSPCEREGEVERGGGRGGDGGQDGLGKTVWTLASEAALQTQVPVQTHTVLRC